MATGVASLREEINAITAVARPEDEVVVRLESPGGAVPHYGLAAAQLARLREKKVKLTVCVDRVAASGGYMMACVADHIVAAPFAIVGSIGVVAQVPNLNRLLKKHDVDFEEMTAGEYKRTVSLFGEITEKGRQKFGEQLEETHTLFKDFVKMQRPSLDIAAVATGEYWLAKRGLELGLVDQLSTSDDYLLSRVGDAHLYQVRFRPEESWRRRIGNASAEILERTVVTVLSRLQSLQLR
jgi:serine protease SohB